MVGVIILGFGLFFEGLNLSWAMTSWRAGKPKSFVILVPLLFTAGGGWLIGRQAHSGLLCSLLPLLALALHAGIVAIGWFGRPPGESPGQGQA